MTFYLDSANAMFANVEELRARRVEWTRWFLIFKFNSNDGKAGYYQIIAQDKILA